MIHLRGSNRIKTQDYPKLPNQAQIVNN